MVSDNPDNKIKLKIFHSEIIQDSTQVTAEMNLFQEIPKVRDITAEQINDNYYQISQDIQNLIDQEVYKIKRKKEGTEAFAEDGFDQFS